MLHAACFCLAAKGCIECLFGPRSGDFGSPNHRKRCYLLGIRSDVASETRLKTLARWVEVQCAAVHQRHTLLECHLAQNSLCSALVIWFIHTSSVILNFNSREQINHSDSFKKSPSFLSVCLYVGCEIVKCQLHCCLFFTSMLILIQYIQNRLKFLFSQVHAWRIQIDGHCILWAVAVMLCYVMLCYVMLCYLMLCHVFGPDNCKCFNSASALDYKLLDRIIISNYIFYFAFMIYVI